MTRELNKIHISHKRVKELLKQKKKTQLDLASDLSFDKDYLNSCLRKELVNKDLLIKIAKYLDCNPLYLHNDNAPMQEYAVFEQWQYDEMQCLEGLIYRALYKPSDFDLKEKNELFSIINKCIEEYAEKKNKTQYDIAFWDGEGTESGVVNITFDKKGSDSSD